MSFRSKRCKVASTSETSEPLEDMHETFFSENENVNLDNDDDHVDDGGQRMRWNNNISFKEDEVVQTIDSEGKISERKGALTSAHVWCLDDGVKIVVEFNDYKQPVGKGGHVLVRFLGAIAKTGELCPIGKASWHHVDEFYKVEILKLIRTKFHLPNHGHVDNGAISHVNDLWRNHRCKLKKEYFDPQKSQQQNASKVPPQVDKQQWIDLVAYWCSPQGKKFSTIGKTSRAEKAHSHTTGSVSFAPKKYQFKKKFNREPNNLEFMKITHERKDGSYVKDTRTQELMDTAMGLVAERTMRSPEKSKDAIENDVFNELMYDDNVHNQRLVGYGFGVSRNHVFGPKAQLRNLAFDTNDSTLTKEFLALKQENAKLKETCTRLELFSNRVTMVLARLGVDLDDETHDMETRARLDHSVLKDLNKFEAGPSTIKEDSDSISGFNSKNANKKVCARNSFPRAGLKEAVVNALKANAKELKKQKEVLNTTAELQEKTKELKIRKATFKEAAKLERGKGSGKHNEVRPMLDPREMFKNRPHAEEYSYVQHSKLIKPQSHIPRCM